MLKEIENGIVIYYFAGLSMVFLLITAIILYALLHQKKVVQLRLRLHEEEILKRQAIFDALQEGQEKERTRLAQELHDGVGAKLSGLKMALEYLKSNTNENEPLISKVFSGVAETLEEVREISHNLHPYFFNDKDLNQLLLNLIEQLNANEGCNYDLSMNVMQQELDKTLKLHVYRIIAELLNNIQKHANATQASVQINMEDKMIAIAIEDDGVGINNARFNSEGIGLMNIKNRVDICKGTMNIDSFGKGTSIIIEIPLNPIA
jgi:two-component system NarL family sensor kinase